MLFRGPEKAHVLNNVGSGMTAGFCFSELSSVKSGRLFAGFLSQGDKWAKNSVKNCNCVVYEASLVLFTSII